MRAPSGRELFKNPAYDELKSLGTNLTNSRVVALEFHGATHLEDAKVFALFTSLESLTLADSRSRGAERFGIGESFASVR